LKPCRHDSLATHVDRHRILKFAARVSVGGDVAHRALPFSAFCVAALVRRTGSHVPEASSASGRRAHIPTNSIRYVTNILLITRIG